MEPRRPLAEAERLAKKVLPVLAPFCERAVAAGSVRRRRPTAGDLDFVLLPHAGRRAELLARIKRTCAIRSGDLPHAQNTIATMPDGFQLDFFFARPAERDLLDTKPTNFGTLLLCRTGSMRHNIALASVAKSKGWHWNPYEGLFDGDGRWLAGDTEESLYAALGLPWLTPEEREEL